MDVSIQSTSYSADNNIFHGPIMKDVTGGVTVDETQLRTDIPFPKGSFLQVDFSAKIANVVKTASVQSTYTSGGSTIQIEKGSQFLPDDYISHGPKAVQINSIDRNNADYDELTLNAALDDIQDITSGTVLYEAGSAGTWSHIYAHATVEGKADDTLTVEVPGTAANGMEILLEQNDSDELSVTYTEGVLTISLANSTASKNSVDNIQTAIRALGITEGIDFSRSECTGSGWDAGGQTGGTITTATDDFIGGADGSDVTHKYIANSVATSTVAGIIEGSSNVITGAAISCKVIEDSLPAPASQADKANMSEVVFL